MAKFKARFKQYWACGKCPYPEDTYIPPREVIIEATDLAEATRIARQKEADSDTYHRAGGRDTFETFEGIEPV